MENVDNIGKITLPTPAYEQSVLATVLPPPIHEPKTFKPDSDVSLHHNILPDPKWEVVTKSHSEWIVPLYHPQHHEQLKNGTILEKISFPAKAIMTKGHYSDGSEYNMLSSRKMQDAKVMDYSIINLLFGHYDCEYYFGKFNEKLNGQKMMGDHVIEFQAEIDISDFKTLNNFPSVLVHGRTHCICRCTNLFFDLENQLFENSHPSTCYCFDQQEKRRLLAYLDAQKTMSLEAKDIVTYDWTAGDTIDNNGPQLSAAESVLLAIQNSHYVTRSMASVITQSFPLQTRTTDKTTWHSKTDFMERLRSHQQTLKDENK